MFGEHSSDILGVKDRKNPETFENLAALIMCVAWWAVHSYNTPAFFQGVEIDKNF